MQFDADTKATSHGSHLVTFDPRPEPEIEDDAQAEAQDLLGELPEFVFTFSRVGVSHGVEPRAQSHSSFVRRTALRSAASCLASVVLPAPGNPQVRISRASLTWSVQQSCDRRLCTVGGPSIEGETGQVGLATPARPFIHRLAVSGSLVWLWGLRKFAYCQTRRGRETSRAWGLGESGPSGGWLTRFSWSKARLESECPWRAVGCRGR